MLKFHVRGIQAETNGRKSVRNVSRKYWNERIQKIKTRGRKSEVVSLRDGGQERLTIDSPGLGASNYPRVPLLVKAGHPLDLPVVGKIEAEKVLEERKYRADEVRGIW